MTERNFDIKYKKSMVAAPPDWVPKEVTTEIKIEKIIQPFEE